MGQEFERSLAELFWLNISHEGAVKMLARSSEDWKTHFQDDTFTWLWAGGPSLPPRGLSRGLPKRLRNVAVDFPRVSDPGERKGRKLQGFF